MVDILPPLLFWEILDELPADKSAIQFPRNPVDYSKDYVVRVVLMNGNEWVGNFHGIDKQYFSGVFHWTKENYLCVVSGGTAYVVQADDPEKYEELSVVPIVDSRSIVEVRMVIFVTFTDIYAYGENGIIWTHELAIDGIEIKKIKNGIIYGISNNINKKVSFSIDIKTGELS